MGVTGAHGAVCQGQTALMLAAYRGHTEVVGILIEAGADVDLQSNNVSSADWVYQMLIIVLYVPGSNCTRLGQAER